MKHFFCLLCVFCWYFTLSFGKTTSSIAPLKSSALVNACQTNLPVNATRWTGGFWADRFEVFSRTSVYAMWQTWNDPTVSHGFRNFEIAAGDPVPDDDHEHWGPPFHDGDMYKWLEAAASVYAINHDAHLDSLMDYFIDRVRRAQRDDGYIHTPVIIEEKNKGIDTHSYAATNKAVIGTAVGGDDDKGAFANRLNFETYNLGHLMTAGIAHFRATGKTTLFDCAIRAANFLVGFYDTESAELARCAICPSHYMGMVEMWRATQNPRYLELAQQLIAIRSLVKNGTDDNQDRIPFEQQYTAMGHAVRATYLYAGVADLLAETSNSQWMDNLTHIWDDLTYRKMYITGGCGALYDGTSPDGTNYTPDSIQKVHQAFGRPYQLPHSTAHNETCAQIGNMLFNWRMLRLTGEAKYANVAERCMLNGILSGISLDGCRYFYTNPLRLSDDLPYTLRWPKERTAYISCFCCPPNTLRTVAEAQQYAFTMGKTADNVPCLSLQFYGEATTTTDIPSVGKVTLSEVTQYPFEGQVQIKIDEIKASKGAKWCIRLRVPDWCEHTTMIINGVVQQTTAERYGYCEVTRLWQKGDVLEWVMDMPVRLMTAHPLCEEARGQVAVQCGPLVYCLESQDLPEGVHLDDIRIPADLKLLPVVERVDGHPVKFLEGQAYRVLNGHWTDHVLYQPLSQELQRVKIRLIPYYAWGNRGKGEMSVWLPLVQ